LIGLRRAGTNMARRPIRKGHNCVVTTGNEHTQAGAEFDDSPEPFRRFCIHAEQSNWKRCLLTTQVRSRTRL